MTLILGSTSPRRVETLRSFSIPFEQVAPDFDEEAVPFKGDPERYVIELAEGKAASLVDHFADDVLLCADTIVYKDSKIFNKPRDADEAFTSLTHLVGRWHTVYTGVCVRQGKTIHSGVAATRVHFINLTPDQIRHYHRQLDCLDKAGGYAIQGPGGLIVREIEGSHWNVLGLPINLVHDLLLKVEIDLWDYLDTP